MGERERRLVRLLFAAESAEHVQRLLHGAREMAALIAELDAAASAYADDGLTAHADLARHFADAAREIQGRGFHESFRESERRAAEPPPLDERGVADFLVYTRAKRTKPGLLAKFLHMRGRGVDAGALLSKMRPPLTPGTGAELEAGIALLMLSADKRHRADARAAWIAECHRRGLGHQAARHRRGLERSLSGGDGEETLRTALNGLGDHLWGIGLIEPSLAAYRDALAVPVKFLEAGGLARAMSGDRLARKLRGLGRIREAIEVLAGTELVLTDLGLLAGMPGVWGLAARRRVLYGLLLEDLREYDRGRHAYEEAVRLAERAGDDAVAFEAWSYVAGSHGKAGRVRAAVRENRRILDWTRSRPGFEGPALNNLGEVLASSGRRAEAARCFRRVVDIHDAAPRPGFGAALAWFGLGDLAASGGDAREAEDAFLRALDVADAVGRRREGLVMLLSRLHRLRGRDELKRRLIAEAEADPAWLVVNVGRQAEARRLAALGDHAGARAVLRDLYRRATARTADAVEVGHIRDALARALADGAPADRREAFDLLWADRDASATDLLVDLLCRADPPDALPDDRTAHELAFDLLEEAKCRNVLPHLAAASFSAPAAVPADLARREAELLKERRDAADSTAVLARERLRGIEESLAEVWSRMEPYDARYVRLRRAHPATLRELRRELAGDTDTTLVSFRVGTDDTIVFTYTPRTDRLSVTRVPVNSAEISDAAHRLERAFNGAPDEFPPLAPLPPRRPWKRDLAFLDDLGARLTGFLANVPPGDHLLVSPDGPLHAVPLHALPVGGEPLVLRHAVTHVSAASALLYTGRRRDGGPRPGAAFCAAVAAVEDPDPDAVEGDAALFTSIGRAVDEVHGRAATRDAVLAGLRSRELAHITCHGHYDSYHPLDSGLLLSDGTDRPSRVPAQMPMDKRLRHTLTVGDMAGAGIDVGLIVLRACSTNRYDPVEQVTSLANVLLFAGARSVIATLWNVDRTSSGRLLAAFYRRLAENPGEPLWRNFWAAQRELIESPRDPWEAHPFHWAPFVLIGDWR
ncbi:CHAT domain-containing tetratricopeptide repeat protein [Actinomadura chibensis]|uniref:CHAT domain-containing protein n=1 Tax=Actinomadura chibensis TaxID=392828 RepID=A0A5D0NLL5_9ACTN|nr:CHAT domain-containing tetratricopeptide repeat protein [Actinomadura chibensis]TYB45373.1 CHAT domain-containing protein [Actinomadura chibensis]